MMQQLPYRSNLFQQGEPKVKDELDPTAMDDQLIKSKSNILQMFYEETENLKTSYQEMAESDIKEHTKKEAVLAALHSLRLSTVKRSVGFLNPDSLFVQILFQYVSELGAAIDTIETSYNSLEESDINEVTKKEAVLHPLNIFLSDIQAAIKAQ